MGKILVAYYSAQDHTRRIAQTIADRLGADVFEIQPAEPYTEADLDWTNNDSRVTREHNNEAEREMELAQLTPENWSEYDTIILGYPIWWGIAAWPVNAFLKGNIFADKTVIPFAVSHSSPLGGSDKLLLNYVSGVKDWRDGIRFSQDINEDALEAWVKGLGLTSDEG
jgi:menaquinone-dependent protoporphyrinogen IX oxidase